MTDIKLSEESTQFDSRGHEGVEKMEVTTMLKHFNEFDVEKRGYMTLKQIGDFLQGLYKREIKYEIFLTNLLLNGQKRLTFDDIIMLVTEIEFYEMITRHVKEQSSGLSRQDCERLLIESELSSIDDRRRHFLENDRLSEFKSLLRSHQRSAERKGDYKEAELVQLKLQEISQKQQHRWQQYIGTLQKYQLRRVQTGVENSYKDFTEQWKNYSEEYQRNAFEYLKLLRAQQEEELKREEKKLRDELSFKLKYSKHVIELRTKQQNLAKLRKYGLAELIKAQADQAELKERKEIDEQIDEVVENKLRALKKLHQQQTLAFIRKVQRERNDQMLQKQYDSERLQNISKNQQFDIKSKFEREKNPFFSMRKQYNRMQTPKSHSFSHGFRTRTKSLNVSKKEEI